MVTRTAGAGGRRIRHFDPRSQPRDYEAGTCHVCVIERHLGTSAALDELDRVAVGISHPSGPEAAVEEVVRSRQQWHAGASKSGAVAIDVVNPEHGLDRVPGQIWTEALIGDRGVNGGDPDLEIVEAQLDVDRHARLRRSKRLTETETLVEADKPHDVVRVDVDHGVP
jgi:hypothetical protein